MPTEGSPEARDFISFTNEEVEAIRDIVVTGDKKEECPGSVLRQVLRRCKVLGADPFARNMYVIRRGTTWAIQCSIDLFRAVAGADPSYAGQDGPYWCGPDAVWKDVWLEKSQPCAAKVGIWGTTFKQALYSVANWDAYAQAKSGGLWEKMGPLMLAKCAEALALRRAFPAKLSGLYTSDEMMQADAPSLAPRTVVPASHGADSQFAEAKELGAKLGKLVGAVMADLKSVGGDSAALCAKYAVLLAKQAPRGTQEPPKDTVSEALADSLPTTEVPSPPEEDGNPALAPAPQVKASMAVMRALLHPSVAPRYASTEDLIALFTKSTGRPVSAMSDLTEEECAGIVALLDAEIKPKEKASEGDVAVPSSAALVRLQAACADADFVGRLKLSQAYSKALKTAPSQRDALRDARLAWGTKVLGHTIPSFSDLPTDELDVLLAAAKAFKEGK